MRFARRRARPTLLAAAVLSSASCGESLVVDAPDASTEAGADASTDVTSPSDATLDAAGGDAAADAPSPKIVFVANLTLPGVMGGSEGGDNVCRKAAEKAGRKGTFVAWLSMSSESALSALTNTNGPWALPSGKIVVPDTQWIIAGKAPLAGIAELIDGGQSDAAFVWTGTSDNGGSTGSTCDDWQSSSPTVGTVGIVGDQPNWTDNKSPQPCGQMNAILCFEI